MKLVAVPVSDLKDTVGRYRFEDGFQLDIAIENAKLMVKFNEGGCELLTEDRKVYFCKEESDRLEFVRDASGKVTGLLGILDTAVKIR